MLHYLGLFLNILRVRNIVKRLVNLRGKYTCRLFDMFTHKIIFGRLIWDHRSTNNGPKGLASLVYISDS